MYIFTLEMSVYILIMFKKKFMANRVYFFFYTEKTTFIVIKQYVWGIVVNKVNL